MISFNAKYGGGVKSVQRGVATPTNGQPLAVTISPVNPAKTTVNLLTNNVEIQFRDGYSFQIKQQLRLLSGTQLEVISLSDYQFNGGSGSLGRPCSWEVIEWN